jgi:MarR family transcriptional regulator, organic hydroperoxide resistance regulator
MSASALQDCLAREHAQALAASALDEALGTYHGLSWADFVLMQHVGDANGGLPDAELARKLGVMRSRLLMRTRPLQKLGWLQRLDGPERRLALLPSGQTLLAEARQTAAAVCERVERATADPW